jgi:hypothetical protein
MCYMIAVATLVASGFNLFYCYRSLVSEKNRKAKPHSSDLKPPLTRFFSSQSMNATTVASPTPLKLGSGLGVWALPVASGLRGIAGSFPAQRWMVWQGCHGVVDCHGGGLLVWRRYQASIV